MRILVRHDKDFLKRRETQLFHYLMSYLKLRFVFRCVIDFVLTDLTMTEVNIAKYRVNKQFYNCFILLINIIPILSHNLSYPINSSEST